MEQHSISIQPAGKLPALLEFVGNFIPAEIVITIGSAALRDLLRAQRPRFDQPVKCGF